MRRVYRGFLLFLFCSVAIHFLLMIALPDFLGNDSGIIPIQLLALRELHLDISGESRVEKALVADRKGGEPVSGEPPVDAAILNRKMAELSLGESLKVPDPDVLPPPIQKNTPREERIRRIRTSPFYKEIAKAFEEARHPTGNYRGKRFSIEPSPDILKKKGAEDDSETELILNRLESATEEKSREKGEEGGFRIGGPVARRALTYVPPIPELKAVIDAEIELKFWVSPNGTVDRVIPLNGVGNAELERTATSYLREWRFRAIPGNEPQIEEWGTVTIQFRLQ